MQWVGRLILHGEDIQIVFYSRECLSYPWHFIAPFSFLITGCLKWPYWIKFIVSSEFVGRDLTSVFLANLESTLLTVIPKQAQYISGLCGDADAILKPIIKELALKIRNDTRYITKHDWGELILVVKKVLIM